MFLNFKNYLLENNLSDNTISNYICSLKLFFTKYNNITKSNLIRYKEYLILHNKPKTVNLRILGINRYLDFINKKELKIKEVKIQQKTYLENVISNADYEYFKKCLKNENNMMWYFVIRCLSATGTRVSELIEYKVEHIKNGFIDIYSKGGKIRRIYIPKLLQIDLLSWFNIINKTTGFIFVNKKNERITTRGIAQQLKTYAKKYKINENVVYPHSFRHLFAKNFIEKYNDIALLADLLGHDSIETTRIYLRKTSTEQKQIVDDFVDW